MYPGRISKTNYTIFSSAILAKIFNENLALNMSDRLHKSNLRKLWADKKLDHGRLLLQRHPVDDLYSRQGRNWMLTENIHNPIKANTNWSLNINILF